MVSVTDHHQGDEELWTSAQAAHAFRVGVSSIKRWTDEGELEAIRTRGNHRRYTPLALHRFASLKRLPVDRLPPLPSPESEVEVPPPADVTLFEALVAGDEMTIRRLVKPQTRSLAQRAQFFDRVVGDALKEIGDRWADGRLSVDQEHRASHLMAGALDQLRPTSPPMGRVALLACPPEEQHDLPLRLVRLLLEWRGWRTQFLGARTPWDALHTAIERERPWMVALSSRTADMCDDHGFREVVEDCVSKGVMAIVGGWWARGGEGGKTHYNRFRTLRGFERWLRELPRD